VVVGLQIYNSQVNGVSVISEVKMMKSPEVIQDLSRGYSGFLQEIIEDFNKS